MHMVNNKTIDYSKYTFTGWGLSKEAMMQLKEIIENNNLKRALEFGSGQSTYFLTDLNLDVVSFDSDKQFAAKLSNVIITDLVQLDDKTFDKVTSNEISFVDISNKFESPSEITTRTKNLFYKLDRASVSGKFDLVILDGPHGNGRSIAYNFIQPYLAHTSYILIDDYTHYPFIEDLKKVFKKVELIKSYKMGRDEWEIYKIES